MKIYRSRINNFKSVMMKGVYFLGMKPKKIAKKINVALASVYRHIK